MSTEFKRWLEKRKKLMEEKKIPEAFPRPTFPRRMKTYQEFVHYVTNLARGMRIPQRDLMQIIGFLWRMREKGLLSEVKYILDNLRF